MSKRGWRQLDLLLLIVFPIVAVVVSVQTHASFLGSTVLFYVLPSLWFSFRSPGAVKKALLFCIILLPVAFIIDYLGTVDQSWFVPITIFPRILEIVVVEDIIWAMAGFFYMSLFYEHFLDRGKNKLNIRGTKALVALIGVISIIFLSALIIRGQVQIPFIYFWAGIVLFIIPVSAFILRFPHILPKLFKLGGYFLVLNFLVEIVGLQLNQWQFTGANFVGWVQILSYRFPLEELVIFIVLGAVAGVTYYEFFLDDHK